MKSDEPPAVKAKATKARLVDPDLKSAGFESTPPEHISPSLALPGEQPAAGHPEFSGPQSVDAFIGQALETSPLVRAARFNVLALKHRIPQVTSLDDPVLSNTIYPIPSAAPQYELMGYMPYGALVAQQFPWCGTLRLRGQAAEDDVRIALHELAAAQLDVVAGVKRAYHDLHFNERALALLEQNRGLAQDFLKIARDRYRLTSASQVDVLRAEVAVSDIDREIETTRQAQVRHDPSSHACST